MGRGTNPMTRDKLIEARKLALKAAFNVVVSENGDWADFIIEAESALPGLSDYIEGKAVVVPVEATGEMERAAIWAMDRAKERDGKLQERRPYGPEEKHRIRYAAMLSASPYRRG